MREVPSHASVIMLMVTLMTEPILTLVRRTNVNKLANRMLKNAGELL